MAAEHSANALVSNNTAAEVAGNPSKKISPTRGPSVQAEPPACKAHRSDGVLTPALVKAWAIIEAASKPLASVATRAACEAAMAHTGECEEAIEPGITSVSADSSTSSVAFLHTSGTLNQVAFGWKVCHEMKWYTRCSDGVRRMK